MRNTVLIVGYAAAGTRARDLAEGATALKMHGRYVPVRARVVQLSGLSAYLVHGEPKAAEFPQERIHERLRWTVVVPRPGEKVLLP